MKCKFHVNWVQTAGVHSQLQSQSFSFPLRHLGTFNVHVEELDKPTCDASQQLQWREWEISWHLKAPTKFGWYLVWEHQYMDFVQRSLFSSFKQALHIPHFPEFPKPLPQRAIINIYIYIYAQKYVHIFNLTSVFLWLARSRALLQSEAKFPHFQAALWGNSRAKRNK